MNGKRKIWVLALLMTPLLALGIASMIKAFPLWLDTPKRANPNDPHRTGAPVGPVETPTPRFTRTVTPTSSATPNYSPTQTPTPCTATCSGSHGATVSDFEECYADTTTLWCGNAFSAGGVGTTLTALALTAGNPSGASPAGGGHFSGKWGGDYAYMSMELTPGGTSNANANVDCTAYNGLHVDYKADGSALSTHIHNCFKPGKHHRLQLQPFPHPARRYPVAHRGHFLLSLGHQQVSVGIPDPGPHPIRRRDDPSGFRQRNWHQLWPDGGQRGL